MDEFEKIIGYDQIKSELRRICDILVNPKKYEKFGVTPSQGLLLHGDPGVGKTLMAQCFIEATKRKCFLCRKSKTNGSFIFEINHTFEEAKESQPSIVFLDDMDKFSNEDPFHSDTDEYVTIQTCIDDVKGSDVFVVATANDIHSLPKSLRREGRFSSIIEVKSVSGENSEKLVEYYLHQKKNLGDINIKEFAKVMEGMTCAEIENIINEAGVYAAYNNKEKIGRDEILQAYLRKVFEAPDENEKNMFSSPEEKKYLAYHEAGHATIAEYFNDSSIALVSVAKHKGDVGGITVNAPSSAKKILSIDKKVQQICRRLGGKAAIEIVFGQIDTGANSDLHRAFDEATEIMDDYCSYGFSTFLKGRETDSNEKKERLDLAVSNELQRLYYETKRILIKNREFLDKLANALVEKTTLLMSDIQKIKSECKIVK